MTAGLRVISFFLQKKFKEKGFMEDLEKNYGVYFDIKTIFKEIKNKLDEIKRYKQLLEYIGSEFGKNMTDFEIIKNIYEKAKTIGLIKDNQLNEEIPDKSEESFDNGRERGRRGRGRFRGRRGR